LKDIPYKRWREYDPEDTVRFTTPTGEQAAGRTGAGGGSAASPSATSSRRTACGSVTAPRIRRGPPAAIAHQPEGDVHDRDRQQEQANERVLGADQLRQVHISES
jgi:hypothetical protein